MKIDQIISSGLLESYVLGITTEEEVLMVQELCLKHPELNKEIELIEEALMNYSSQTTKPLNPDLKEKISNSLSFNTVVKPQALVIPLNTPANTKLRFYQTGIAASILLLIISGVYILSLNQKVNQLHGQLAELSSSKSVLADQLTVQQASLQTLASNLNVVSDPGMKAIPLNGMNSLVSKSAVIHWNPETQEVYFNANALPASPSEKQYQLWAIIDGKPVDAGVINFENGVVFQKMKPIAGAKAFAVTIENKGGSISPTIDTMCLLGNV